MRLIITIAALLIFETASTQTIGGNTVFNFLRLSATPQLSALGGVNVSHLSDDVGLAYNNPSLLRPAMHTQFHASFNNFYDAIKAYHVSLAYDAPSIKTTFGWGLHYIDYGKTAQTDASGNIFGDLRPLDWVMQVSASRSYLEKWRYGLTIKFISSNYGIYRANGIATDVGILYADTAVGLSVSVLAKNMGSQFRTYSDSGPDDLPFDLQAGISKRFAKSPFGVSFTAHHLHRFDIQYSDDFFNGQNGFPGESSATFSFDKLFRHFVIAGNIYLGDNVVIDAGYNYLRRQELKIGDSGNGLTGFSMGVALLLSKLQVRYARSQYQNNSAYNQFGLNLTLNKYFTLGKFGRKAGW